MNATHLFEKVQGDRFLPPSSESFWTTIFALFLLHVASKAEEIALWQPISSNHSPWYERMPRSSWLRTHGLDFDGLTVEPSSVMDVWPNAGITPTLGGISPDVVARVPSTGTRPRHVLIENKVTSGAFLKPNQTSGYPELIRFLEAGNIDAALFILQSIGCSQRLYAQTKALQGRLGERFGILLWEDIFRLMHRSGFAIPGVDTGRLQKFTEDAAADCREW